MTVPPTAHKNIARLYRISFLIAQKADKDRRDPSVVRKELQDILGYTTNHMIKIINTPRGKPGFLSVNQLMTIAEYFGVSIDDLINKELHSPSSRSGADVSGHGTGHFIEDL